MEINIESPHLQLSQILKHKIEHKFSHLQKIYDRITSCTVVVFQQRDDEQQNCFIEARLLLPQHELFVKEHAEDFDRALYQSIKKLLQQLKHFKEKLQETR